MLLETFPYETETFATPILSSTSATLRMEDVMYGAKQLAPIFKDSAGDIVEISKIVGDAVATTGEDAVNNYKGAIKGLAQMYTKEQIFESDLPAISA